MEVVSGGLAARRAHQDAHPGQRGRGVPRLEGRDRQQHRARPDVPRSRSRAWLRAPPRAAACRRRPIPARWRCSGSSSPPTSPGRCTSAAAATRRAYFGFLAVGAVVFAAGVLVSWVAAAGTSRSRSRLASTVVAARRRPPRRRPARAQHRVRVLGDGGHPGIGAGQPHVRTAHRGGPAARRPGRVATPRPAHRVRGDRHARDHAAGDGRAAVRRRLRRRDGGCARASACSPGCSSDAGPRSAPSSSSVRCSWWRACVVGFADLMRPEGPADPRGPVLRQGGDRAGSATSSSRIRRKAMENLDSFTGTRLLWVLPDRRRCSSGSSGACRGGRVRALFREVPVIRQTLLALRRGRVPRLRAQRLRDRHPRAHGGGVRVRGGVRGAGPGPGAGHRPAEPAAGRTRSGPAARTEPAPENRSWSDRRLRPQPGTGLGDPGVVELSGQPLRSASS